MKQNLKNKIIQGGLNVSFLLFFALSLAIPTGYSYGAVGALLFTFLGLGALKRGRCTLNTWVLVGSLLAMGLVWGLSFDGWGAWASTDLFIKYWLAAFVLAVVSLWGIQHQFVQWGVGLGGLGALLIALYQNFALGISKATGYTNAIQYGGIAMYLGLASWCIALVGARSWTHRLVCGALGTCGVLASFLSETRGSWVAAIALCIVLVVVLIQHGYARWALGGGVAMALIVGALLVPYGQKIEKRVDMAVDEVQQYVREPEIAAETSVGQRLEQWRTATLLIQMKPLTGWGNFGNRDGKQMLVDQGLAHPSIMEYGHAHNEIIDMLAKRGVLGLFFLLMFYGIPVYLFWPTKKRIQNLSAERRSAAFSIRLIAILLPIAYFAFGWTQVFFGHNSGNMFYIFSLAAFWGALQRLEGQLLQTTN